MNKKIKELAELTAMNRMNRRGDGFYVVSEYDLEQFAQLVIKQCIQLVNKNVNDLYPTTMIKKEFGIKELTEQIK